MRCSAIIADFETRSRVNLKKCGAWRYSRDASTDALYLGYRIDGGPRRRWRRGDPPPRDLFKAIADGAFFEAHNIFFEWCIWHNVMVRKYGWPPLKKNRVICLAARASYSCLPRALELAAYHAGLEMGKGDDKAMKKLSKPRKPTKANPKEWIDEKDDPATFMKLYEYGDQDVEVEWTLSKKLPALPRFERQLFLTDLNINLRGLLCDREYVVAAMGLNRMIDKEISDELMKLTRGKVTKATQGERIQLFLEESGLKLQNMTEETVTDALFRGELTKVQRRVLELRREGNRGSVRKLFAFDQVMDTDDIVRGLYLYYGANAHGRFSGKNPQPQNMPRGDAKVVDESIPKAERMEYMVACIKEAWKKRDLNILRERFYIEESEVYGDPKSKRRKVPCPPAELLSTSLRGAFIARKGKTYGVGDYAAIELRVLFWLADEKFGLKLLREGKDVYRDMGGVIFNKRPEDLDVDFERMLGKTTVLGCGYEMSWKKFKLTCKKAYNMILSAELCKRSVYGFRGRYKRVPKYWRELQDAAIACVKTGITKKVSGGKVSFSMRKGDLVITLPSGREIYHRKAKVSRDGDLMFVNGKGWVENTYGGKLCEYICSGTARDFLADAIVKGEQHPEIDVVMHSHDELAAEGEPGKVAKIVEKIMLDVPAWGRSMPMKVEAWEGPRYRK